MADSAVPSRREYLRAWSALHDGIDPQQSRLIGPWLSGIYVLARPIAAIGVSPTSVSVAGLMLAAAAAAVANQGGRWALLAGALILLGGVVDNLDGAVAILTQRTSRWGALLDSVIDRLAEALALIAMWQVGAPAAWCVLAGALTWLAEYVRARAQVSGLPLHGVVTPGERPTRVLIAGLFLLAAGLFPATATTWLAIALLAWLITAALSLVLLLRAAHPPLRPSDRQDISDNTDDSPH